MDNERIGKALEWANTRDSVYICNKCQSFLVQNQNGRCQICKGGSFTHLWIPKGCLSIIDERPTEEPEGKGRRLKRI